MPSGKSAEAATGRQARAALLKRAKRSNVPLRRDFVQLSDKNKTRTSVLAEFVKDGRLRALRAYLIVLAASSSEDERGAEAALAAEAAHPEDQYANVAEVLSYAAQRYAQDVREGEFPAAEHPF